MNEDLHVGIFEEKVFEELVVVLIDDGAKTESEVDFLGARGEA